MSDAVDRATLPGTWFYVDGAWEKRAEPGGWESPEIGYAAGYAPDLAQWHNADSGPSRPKPAKIANPYKINRAFCEALGINPNDTLSVTINLGGGKDLIIEVRMFLDTEKALRVAEVIKRFTLVETT